MRCNKCGYILVDPRTHVCKQRGKVSSPSEDVRDVSYNPNYNSPLEYFTGDM